MAIMRPLLRSTWSLEDVSDVEGLVCSVIDSYLGRRGAYLRTDQREELEAYLLGQVWILYVKFDPSKASTPLSLSTYLVRRLTWATTDWFRQFFGDSRYRKYELALSFEELNGDEPAREDAVSLLPSLSNTGRERWARFGILSAAGYDFAEIARRTGVSTGKIGAELKELKDELDGLGRPPTAIG
jgi:hypothetical protein